MQIGCVCENTVYHISIDHEALSKQGDNALGSVCPCACLRVICEYLSKSNMSDHWSTVLNKNLSLTMLIPHVKPGQYSTLFSHCLVPQVVPKRVPAHGLNLIF